MRTPLLIILTLLTGAWFLAIYADLQGISGTKPTQGLLPYERYANNTVGNQSWPEDADQMVRVRPDNGHPPYFIDKYEATISKQRAWSVPGQNPTTKLSFLDAQNACRAANKRICTTEEWRIACRDGGTKPVLFQRTDIMLKNCDFGRSKGYDSQDFPNKTDSHPNCVAPKLRLHHMYGNIVEMTEGQNGKVTVLGMSYLGTHYYGQAFSERPHDAMRNACEYTVMDNYGTRRVNEGLGFRCCRDTGNRN